MKSIREIVEAHTKEGVTDWETADKVYQDTINGIVVKETAKTAEKAQQDTILELGLENVQSVADLKKYSDSMKKSIEERETQIKEATEQIGSLQSKTTQYERERSIIALGITDPDTIDYLTFNVSKRLDDNTDWNKALEGYKTDKPHLFEKTPTITTTGARVSGDGTTEKFGWETKLEEKYPDLKE